jgi:cobalt-zinc-cadmium efflux system membrane fusion protein
VQARVQIADATVGTGPLMIPAVAVQTVESQPAVFIRTKAGFRVAPVTLGQRNGALVAVTHGLSGSETIAAQNSFTLKAELGKGEAEHGEH